MGKRPKIPGMRRPSRPFRLDCSADHEIELDGSVYRLAATVRSELQKVGRRTGRLGLA